MPLISAEPSGTLRADADTDALADVEPEPERLRSTVTVLVEVTDADADALTITAVSAEAKGNSANATMPYIVRRYRQPMTNPEYCQRCKALRSKCNTCRLILLAQLAQDTHVADSTNMNLHLMTMMQKVVAE